MDENDAKILQSGALPDEEVEIVETAGFKRHKRLMMNQLLSEEEEEPLYNSYFEQSLSSNDDSDVDNNMFMDLLLGEILSNSDSFTTKKDQKPKKFKKKRHTCSASHAIKKKKVMVKTCSKKQRDKVKCAFDSEKRESRRAPQNDMKDKTYVVGASGRWTKTSRRRIP